MGLPARRSVTADDLWDVPEGMIGEILAGELVVSPRPAPRHSFAQASLGQFYETGRGVFRNADEAFRLYSMAAAQGHAGGQYLLGRAYEVGIGAAKDPQRALYWYRKAAGAGSSEAATRVRQLGAGG